MIKYFLSCRGGWSENLQIIDDKQVRETQEKQRQMQLIVDAMTDEEIDEYKSHSDKMKQIVAGARERVG